jgi:hypothetical protein
MKLDLKLVMSMLIAVGSTARTGAEEGPGPVVIRDCSIFDVERGLMLPNRTVVLLDGKIQSIGTSQTPVESPPGATTIEAKGKFLIPGLIDAHVHVVQILASAHITGDEILPLFLAAGVTSVRSTGDEIVPETLVARFAADHPRTCPRVFTCSPLIDGDPPFHHDDSPAMVFGRALTDPAKVPAFVADMQAWGATSLKIYVGVPREIGRLVIDEGHKRGLKVIGHLGRYSAQDAVADGIDVLEHIWGIWDFIVPPEESKRPNYRSTLDLNNHKAKALIAEVVRRKTIVDPTLAVFRNMILLNDLPEYYEHPDNALMPARLLKHWTDDKARINARPETLAARRGEFAKYQELTGVLYRAGVTLLAGTDTAEPYVPPGFSLHQELEMLVESGLPPAAALRCATLNNALALGQQDRLGTIAPGKTADLILLAANPLEKITNTRRIERVIKGGHLCDPKALLMLVPRQ